MVCTSALYPVEVQPVNDHGSSGNHPRHALCILLDRVRLAKPLDKVVAHRCLVSRANCTYLALAHHE